MEKPSATSSVQACIEYATYAIGPLALARPLEERERWAEALVEGLYVDGQSLMQASAEEWAAMKIPMRLRTLIRHAIAPELEDELDRPITPSARVESSSVSFLPHQAAAHRRSSSASLRGEDSDAESDGSVKSGAGASANVGGGAVSFGGEERRARRTVSLKEDGIGRRAQVKKQRSHSEFAIEAMPDGGSTDSGGEAERAEKEDGGEFADVPTVKRRMSRTRSFGRLRLKEKEKDKEKEKEKDKEKGVSEELLSARGELMKQIVDSGKEGAGKEKRLKRRKSGTPQSLSRSKKGVVHVLGDDSIVERFMQVVGIGTQNCFRISEKTSGVDQVAIKMLLSLDTVEMTFIKKNDCGAEEALKECDVVLVMFSVIDTHSLNNIITKFLPHLRLSMTGQAIPPIPLVLMGTDCDKRTSGERKHVTVDQALQVQSNFKALLYLETNWDERFYGLLQELARAVCRERRLKRTSKEKHTAAVAKIQRAVESKVSDLQLQKFKLEMLPNEVLYLRSLTKIRASGNSLKDFPHMLFYMPTLTEIDLSDNSIGNIPDDISVLAALVKLDVENNKLEDIPLAALQAIPSLTEVRVKGNPLANVPRSYLDKKKACVNLSASVVEDGAVPSAAEISDSGEADGSSTAKKTAFRRTQTTAGVMSLANRSSNALLELRGPPKSDEKAKSTKQPDTTIFEMQLDELLEADRHCDPQLKIPLFFKRAINHIITTGLETQGIFRLEGSSGEMQGLKEQLRPGVDIRFEMMENPSNVCGILKQWLRSRQVPILPSIEALTRVIDGASEQENILLSLELLDGLSTNNRELVIALLHLLVLTSANADINKMDEVNVARVMANNIVWPTTDNPSAAMITQLSKSHEAFGFLIEHYPDLIERRRRPATPEDEAGSQPFMRHYFDDDAISQFHNPFAVIERKFYGGQKALTAVCLAGVSREVIESGVEIANDPGNPVYTSRLARFWTADEKGVVQVWNANQLFRVREIDAGGRVNAIVGVGSNVWIGTIKGTQVRNARDGELVKEISTPGYNFVPAGEFVWSTLWTGTEGKMILYHAEAMKVKKELPLASRISSLIAVGSRVCGSCQDKKLRLWNAQTFELEKEVDTEHSEKLNGLCFVPPTATSGGTVWCTSDDMISVWDEETFECKQRLIGYHKKRITGAMWMGGHVWSYGWDSSIHVWDAQTCEHVAELHSYHNQPISDLRTDYQPGDKCWRVYSASYDHACVIWRCRDSSFSASSRTASADVIARHKPSE